MRQREAISPSFTLSKLVSVDAPVPDTDGAVQRRVSDGGRQRFQQSLQDQNHLRIAQLAHVAAEPDIGRRRAAHPIVSLVSKLPMDWGAWPLPTQVLLNDMLGVVGRQRPFSPWRCPAMLLSRGQAEKIPLAPAGRATRAP
ncbi:hypothetical protein [Tahibacter aquaticus]|uniref:hypothetical protein n=1 Tax=Tahibacter aquaticus TaxID=520092 RepID=UPI00105E373C|nr:hypothetical protein [Tahibacter aquaticus]